MRLRLYAAAVICGLLVLPLHAATFVVPSDRPFMQRSPAIVIATAESSIAEIVDDGAVETVTTFSIEEVIKGAIPQLTLQVREPGGAVNSYATIIPGVPRFNDGERYLLFIARTPRGWSAQDLVLGKFSFARDVAGRQVLVRDEDEIAGWNEDGTAFHGEGQRRGAQRFLAFLRNETTGRAGDPDYWVPRDRLMPGIEHGTTSTIDPTNDAATATTADRQLTIAPAIAPYSANSYTFSMSGSLGGRWNIFPAPLNFFSVGTEPGAPGGGVTAINAAFAAWNNEPNSNVNLVYVGADISGTHNGGVRSPDGQNTVAFEQDLSYWGVSRFQCSGNSYSGTLGMGGITRASGTHTGPNNETFVTALEGDVQMNVGIANCSLLFNNGDFNSAVAHEVGHSLGFRHSDQGRVSGSPCTADVECATVAIMKSFVSQGLNATLQTYDQHAVAAVYPGSGGTGTGGGTTFVFTDDPLVAGVTVIKAIHLAELRTAVNSVRARAGLAPATFTDAATPGIVVKAVHINELRTALDAARAALGLSTGGWTDTIAPGVVIRARHFQEIRERIKAT